MTDRTAVTDGITEALKQHERSAEQRKRLLARMAGNIASGYAAAGFGNDSDYVATVSIEVAERILAKVGL